MAYPCSKFIEGPWDESSPYALWIEKISNTNGAVLQLKEVSDAFRRLRTELETLTKSAGFANDDTKSR